MASPLTHAGSVKEAALSSKGIQKPLKMLGSLGVGVGGGQAQIYIFKIPFWIEELKFLLGRITKGGRGNLCLFDFPIHLG